MGIEDLEQGLLERIQKLHAKAVSAKEIGSEAEAATFMEAVHKMLNKYDLDMSEVDYQVQLRGDAVKLNLLEPATWGKAEKKQTTQWELTIASGICDLYKCRMILGAGNSFYIMGRKQHRDIASYMTVMILRLAEELVQRAYVKEFYYWKNLGLVERARGFKHGFLLGFSLRLANRCFELTRSTKATAAGMALVRINKEEQLLDQFSELLTNQGSVSLVKRKESQRNYSHRGAGQGVAAAEDVNLTARAMSTPASAPKRLGSGA